MKTAIQKLDPKTWAQLKRLAFYAGTFGLIVTVVALTSGMAYANSHNVPTNIANESWATGASSAINRISGLLVYMGAGLLIAAVAIVGMSYYFSREFRLDRIYPLILGAALMFLGGPIINGILGQG